MTEIFPLVILNGRPAAGKSEIIRALQNTPVDERIKRFYIGPMHVIDDFPMLWAWFEEDTILVEMGLPPLHTTPDGNFKDDALWNVLIRRLDLDYQKWRRDHGFEHTVVLEFSRGAPHGGYRSAYQHFTKQLLAKAVLVYINVSYEESLRKNRARSNPDRPDSILQHSLSDEKVENLYRDNDWVEFSSQDPQFIEIDGMQVPYAIFENEDDVTTQGGIPLLNRLEEIFTQLWTLYRMKQV